MSGPKWVWEFVESGGYDSMTDAVYVKRGFSIPQIVMDLSAFGQKRCAPCPVEARRDAETLAARIVKALNDE